MGEELEALARRCEEATGADRKLDAQIAAIVRLGAVPAWAIGWSGEWRAGADGEVTMMTKDGTPGPWFQAHAYTASLDAAMTLVPEGASWEMECQPKTTNASILYADWKDGNASTPALALCAAALRARASLEAEG